MRNIKTREGFEFWDKLNALPRFAFLLSPSGKSVQKFEDQAMGNWIDVHEAQKVVDQAQDEINQFRAERDALQLLLNQRDEQNHSLEQRRQAEQQACQAAEKHAERYLWLLANADLMHWENMLRCADLEGIESINQFIDAAINAADEVDNPRQATDSDWRMNPCKQGHRDVGAAGGVAHCYTCDEKIEAATTQEAFERWNATHPAAQP
ncbi:hypothetical protein B0E42_13210 [Pseudomonas sp. A25(2017)]|uniref:hypothetical protein n=1 Tax=Pseudomonas sp. A25(2017) TaxID=1945865 RepID=UPI0009877C55|nr:hypothetical protein [Pseudomonas sp. A25(2017)]OOG85755.1 hypothetical protein B0E42_13210 [Pseudomonas sp. A25(2017)]